MNYPDLSLLPAIANSLETSVADLLGLEQNISDSTIDEISKLERRQLLKIIYDYLEYVWEKFNIQFWINGILLALALTLITNGIWLLIKYKRLDYFLDNLK